MSCTPASLASDGPLFLLADVNDVVESLRFAADNSLRASAYGAGHQVVGVSLLPNGIVIDTKNLTAIDVDPESETAYVQAGRPPHQASDTQVLPLAATQVLLLQMLQ